MIDTPASISLEILVVLLLVVTVIFAWKLSKRINELQRSKEEMARFILDFDAAIKRAQTNIEDLKTLGEETDNQLVDHINKARFLANDLSFLMEKGNNVADALEHYIEQSKSSRSQSNPPTSSPKPQVKKEPLTQLVTKQPPSKMTPSKKRALDEVLSQIAAKKKPPPEAPRPAQQAAPNGESKPKANALEQAMNKRRLEQAMQKMGAGQRAASRKTTEV